MYNSTVSYAINSKESTEIQVFVLDHVEDI